MTSLIIGSMAPDFDYIIHTQTGTSISHSLAGVIYYCLPITVGVAFLWHFIIKPSLASALPNFLVRKYSDWLLNSWDCKSLFRFLIILVSAVIGTITHLTWDSFTHISGYFVQNIAFLTKITFIYNFPVFKLLQYGCGLLGAFLVLYIVIIHSSQKPQLVVHRYPKCFWITALFVFIVFGITHFLTLTHVSLVQLVRYSVINLLSGSAISITIASVVVRIYHSFQPYSEK
jgi:hypothetical protein